MMCGGGIEGVHQWVPLRASDSSAWKYTCLGYEYTYSRPLSGKIADSIVSNGQFIAKTKHNSVGLYKICPVSFSKDTKQRVC